MYGPTIRPTGSLLSIDPATAPRCYWKTDLDPGLKPVLPILRVEADIRDVGMAQGTLTANSTVLFEAPEEKVTLHFTRLGQYLGAHLVTEARTDGLIAAYFVCNNGTCDPSFPGSWRGMVRFSEIRIRLQTPGWVMVTPDGASTTVLSLGGVGDWMAKSRAWFSQKFVLCPSALVPRAIALLQMLNLDLSDGHPALGPLAVKTPPIKHGQFYPLSPNIPPRQGPFWYDRDDNYDGHTIPNPNPKGAPDAPAGTRIDPNGGGEATVEAARLYAADVPRLLAGSSLALFDWRDGDPIRPDEWTTGPFEYSLTSDRSGYNNWNSPGGIQSEFGGPVMWVNGVQAVQWKRANPGPCVNETLAQAYLPFDDAHLCRITQGLKGAWWLCRDWCAWLALRVIAMDVCSCWSLDGRPAGQSWSPFSMESAMSQAHQLPGNGDGFLRAQGWIMDAVGTALSLPYVPNKERRYLLTWRRTMLEFQELCVMPSGLARNGLPNLRADGTVQGGSDNGVPWLVYGLPPTSGACAAWQAAIHASGFATLVGATDLPTYDFTRTLIRGVKQLLDNPLMPRVIGGTPYYVETSVRDATGRYVPVPELTLGVGAAYNTVGVHDWHWLALLYLATRDDYFLNLICAIEQPKDVVHRLAAWKAAPSEWTSLPIAVLSQLP